MVIMWNKMSLRTKITLLTACALTLITVCITLFSNYNVWRNIITPLGNLEDNVYNVYIEIAVEIDRNEVTDEFWQNIYYHDGTMEIQLLLRESQVNFQKYSIITAVIFILIGTIAAYVISGQTLKPIKLLAIKMEEIDANNLSTPIETEETNDEVSCLARSFNNLLEKLNRVFESQKFFAQNAAHELKTPLTSIRTNIEVLRLDDEPSTNEYKEVIEIVNDNTERLIELVEGLLRLSSSTDESGWQTFDCKETFEIIINELQKEIVQKGLGVSISGNYRIKGCKTLMERAFFNLVHNAVRYNVENGMVDISLSNNGIVIEDNGAGIPAEHLVHIFEPFYCVDKSRSRELGGHGLGMAIAKNIFDRHKMDIHIYSEQGKGTKIIISSHQTK